jgi:CubicO group peptidase (beta-lactamase class C family)
MGILATEFLTRPPGAMRMNLAAWPLRAAMTLLALAWMSVAFAQTPPRYPGAAWDELTTAQSGWSAQGLADAEEWSRAIGSSAVVIVQHGAIVGAWGDVDADLGLHSVRKSLLSALIGVAAEKGRINLNATMAELGIDDNPPALTPTEKQATVLDLLEARSGVYHAANYETHDMAAKRPARGEHPPGTFWYYNNWDFNALGAIYEHSVGAPVFTAFAQQIATPLEMQDFDPAKCKYVGGPSSIYPAYVFYASARDLARFSLLYLRRGRWGDKQIVPAEWVDRSTNAYSTTDHSLGYGFLWWIVRPDAPSPLASPPGTLFALGNGGQFVIVIPAYDLVVVHLVRIKRDASTGQQGVSMSQMSHLLTLILTARPDAG